MSRPIAVLLAALVALPASAETLVSTRAVSAVHINGKERVADGKVVVQVVLTDNAGSELPLSVHSAGTPCSDHPPITDRMLDLFVAAFVHDKLVNVTYEEQGDYNCITHVALRQ